LSKSFFVFLDFRFLTTQNRDPRFYMSFLPPCDQKFSITVIVIIEKFIVKMRSNPKSRPVYS
jgi:hypothetical protein